MEIPSLIERSHVFCEDLHDLLHGQSLPSDTRSLASAACLHLALEHHRAVVLLFRRPLVVSAGAMLRSQLEAYVKGAWLNRCAKESDVGRFEKEKEPPQFREMVGSLEKALPFYGSELANIKKETWRPLNNYVHSDANQAWRRIKGNELAASGSSAEIAGGLHLASRIGTLVGLEFASLANSDQLSQRIQHIYVQYIDNAL